MTNVVETSQSLGPSRIFFAMVLAGAVLAAPAAAALPALPLGVQIQIGETPVLDTRALEEGALNALGDAVDGLQEGLGATAPDDELAGAPTSQAPERDGETPPGDHAPTRDPAMHPAWVWPLKLGLLAAAASLAMFARRARAPGESRVASVAAILAVALAEGALTFWAYAQAFVLGWPWLVVTAAVWGLLILAASRVRAEASRAARWARDLDAARAEAMTARMRHFAQANARLATEIATVRRARAMAKPDEEIAGGS